VSSTETKILDKYVLNYCSVSGGRIDKKS